MPGSLLIPYRGCDLTQAHLGYVAGGKAEGACGIAGVEFINIMEVFVNEILSGVDAAAGEEHIRHAVLDGMAVFDLDIKVVQFL